MNLLMKVITKLLGTVANLVAHLLRAILDLVTELLGIEIVLVAHAILLYFSDHICRLRFTFVAP